MAPYTKERKLKMNTLSLAIQILFVVSTMAYAFVGFILGY